MSMQPVEESPPARARHALRLVREEAPLPPFAPVASIPAPVPDFGDRTSDLIPTALPIHWEPAGS